MINDGQSIVVDCGYCGGCGESDPHGYDCSVCNGVGYAIYPLPRRDYELEGMRAFSKGRSSNTCPYRYGWPRLGWYRGFEHAEDLSSNR
jgi:hypothetical protein